MSFAAPWLLLLIPCAWVLVWWASRRSSHPMPTQRRHWASAVRCLLIAVILTAAAGPWIASGSGTRAVAVVIDASQSMGPTGWEAARQRAQRLISEMPSDRAVAVVAVGRQPMVLQAASRDAQIPEQPPAQIDRSASDLAAGLAVARGLFPPGSSRTIVLLSDGIENHGDVQAMARNTALDGTVIHCVPVSGTASSDARMRRLSTSRTRAHAGAAIDLSAEIETSLSGVGDVVLSENGVEVERRALRLVAGSATTVVFTRVPHERNLYTWRARLSGFIADALPANDAAVAVVDVTGPPRVLMLSGEGSEDRTLIAALKQEGIDCIVKKPGECPTSIIDLAAYDALILNDVPARQLSEAAMSAMRAVVEELGGGIIAIGGVQSFGVGGWYRTPLEDMLPVILKSPDTEEKVGSSLCLVIDRSGSMSGEKLEMVKSAAIATVHLLQAKDYVGVVAFDSNASWVVPMQKVTAKASIEAQIASIQLGGGTNIFPGMTEARAALQRLPTKVRHMIVLTDGQSEGSGYAELAAACRAEKMTISTVGVGGDADGTLLQAIATAGGGTYHFADNPASLPKIFTQDAMTHLGKVIREQAFQPRPVERHPMLEGIDLRATPQLLGYVRTQRRSTAQVPLVTDLGEPLLAHWRYGLGKVTAFTSDATARWSALWLARWGRGYTQLWSQVVRETAREPQGHRLDVRLNQRGEHIAIEADVLENAASYRNDAAVEAQVFFIPSAGGAPQPVGTPLTLDQAGPGRYRATFRPASPGVYVVRTTMGADHVPASIVHESNAEVAEGRIDRHALQRIASIGGGALLDGDAPLPSANIGGGDGTDLAPWLVVLALLLVLLDVAVRRWDHVQGVIEMLSRRTRR